MFGSPLSSNAIATMSQIPPSRDLVEGRFYLNSLILAARFLAARISSMFFAARSTIFFFVSRPGRRRVLMFRSWVSYLYGQPGLVRLSVDNERPHEKRSVQNPHAGHSIRGHTGPSQKIGRN